MSDWVQHDGKGVPKDAIPGVTIFRAEPPDMTATYVDGHPPGIRDGVWDGVAEPWDWANFGKFCDMDQSKWCRFIAYRNPSAAAFKALEAIAADPKAKFRKLVDA